jgi:integrase
LQLADVHVSERANTSFYAQRTAKARKAARSRWDRDTLADLTAWKAERVVQTTNLRVPFVACQKPTRLGRVLSRHNSRRRFLTACKMPGTRERLATLTIHLARHTFISHALAGARTLVEVRLAAGKQLHSHLRMSSLLRETYRAMVLIGPGAMRSCWRYETGELSSWISVACSARRESLRDK